MQMFDHLSYHPRAFHLASKGRAPAAPQLAVDLHNKKLAPRQRGNMQSLSKFNNMLVYCGFKMFYRDNNGILVGY